MTEIKQASGKTLGEVYNLRREVFVDEQHVSPEEEFDGLDETAFHAAVTENGEVVACGRMIAEGRNAHFGRIAVRSDKRNRDYGRKVCMFLLEHAAASGYDAAVIHAQLHAKAFYEKLGFVPEGGTFCEAGIEHIAMKKQLAFHERTDNTK